MTLYPNIERTEGSMTNDFIVIDTNAEEQRNYIETATSCDWQFTMNEEMKSIAKNNTQMVVNLLLGKKPIIAKWVYNINPNLHRKPEKLKTCIVERGFERYDEQILTRLLLSL